MEYDEFGILVQRDTRKAEDSNFSYTGHLYEESSGLYFAKARYYQAEDGRFLSEDAYRGETSKEGNWNRYTYVKNNPVKYQDPSGNTFDLVQGLDAFETFLFFLLEVAAVASTFFKVKEISMDVLKTDIGKKKAEQADQVIHNGATYTSKQFIKMFPSTTDVDWNNVVENNIKWDKKKKAEGKGKTGKEKTKARNEKTAGEIIGEEKKAAINNEFPKEWLDSTLDDIEKAAKKGDSKARKAKKLLNDKRFDKGDNRK